MFCLSKFTESSKKRKSVISVISYLHFTFWYEIVNFCNRILTSMLRFKLVVSLNKREVIEWYDTKYFGFLSIRSLKKEFRGN